MGKSKAWPPKGEAVSVCDLTEPVCEAIRFAYDLKRKNIRRSIPWNGYDFGANELVTSPPPHESLRRGNLEYNLEDQGQDALEVLVGIAIQLGIEQGRRVERTSTVSDLRMMTLRLKILNALKDFKASY